MSFSPNIPNLTDFLAISQKQLLANFQAINDAFLQNHVSLTNDVNFGKHDQLTLRPQAADPNTVGGQSAIYNKLVGGQPQLFFRPNDNQTPIQLTNSNLNTAQTGATEDKQSSFLAGPFTIYMGYIRNCPNGQVVTLLPSSTLIYVGLTTIVESGIVGSGLSFASATSVGGNQFTVTYGPPLTTFTPNPTIYYLAIGQ